MRFADAPNKGAGRNFGRPIPKAGEKSKGAALASDAFFPFGDTIEAAGKAAVIAERKWDERQYLWPIPTTEMLINKNMKQNPGY